MKAHVSKNLDAALEYARQGKPVFPCNPKDKRPLTKNGFKDATADPEKIKAWWSKRPDAMIGMPTGALSEVDVVDLDRKPDHADGVVTWEKLENENSPVNTRTHGTPSTGQHKFFQHQNGLRSIGLDRLAAGLEVKADGGYVIMPPSRMANGKGYTVIKDIEPAPMPPWLQEMIRRLKDFDEQIEQDARATATSANETRPDLELIKAALNAIPSDATGTALPVHCGVSWAMLAMRCLKRGLRSPRSTIPKNAARNGTTRQTLVRSRLERFSTRPARRIRIGGRNTPQSMGQ
jgi:hypothetical protein